MKIKYLGTAAAEGIPALFCTCEVCQNARKVGGKEVKTRSQSILDDKILIDFPADTYMHALYHGVDLPNIRTCLITHNHGDHLYTADLWCRGKGIAYGVEGTTLNMYAYENAYEQIDTFVKEAVSDNRVAAHAITPFEPFEVEGYTVTALDASHDKKSSPVIYWIEKEGKTLFYANDTSDFPEKTWDFLAKSGQKADLLSLDCTEMLHETTYVGHSDLRGAVKIVEHLKAIGVVTDATKVVLNHFSHNGRATHEQFAQAAAAYGFEVAYDGLTVEF